MAALPVKTATSEPMQPATTAAASAAVSRPPRAERTTTSCGECRRRKQKCNQGQPCSNCARRFPQPACEYKASGRRPGGVGAPQRPAFSVSLSPPSSERSGVFVANTQRQPLLHQQESPFFLSWEQQQLQHQQQQQQQRTIDDPNATTPTLTGWSGLDPFDQSPSHEPHPQIQQPQPSFSTNPFSPSSQYAWSTDQQSLSMSVIACEEGCSAHSEEVHRSIQMMQAYRSTAWGSEDRRYNGSAGWNQSGSPGYSAWTLVPALGPGQGPHHEQQCDIPWPGGNVPASIATAGLPATPAMQDEDLLSVFINFISQFTASLDGKPDASSPYLKHYLPHCLSSRLLTHVAIYSAACFLTDTGHIERTAAMAHKGRVIALLNEHIRAQGQAAASDEVIAGVLQIVLDEWLWGSAKDLKAHLRGLRDMILSRGGFRSLGLHGLLTKLAISVDAAIALSLETPPFLRGGPEFEFRDATTSSTPLRLALNTPLIPNPVRFASCAEALHIHPSAASILDDMRFLLAAVLALPDEPTAKELQKVHTTSAWLYERLSGLPEDAPGVKGKSGDGSEGREGNVSGNLQQPPPQQRQRQQQQQHHPPSPPATSNFPPSCSDPIYQTIRLAALLYTHTIKHRLPFSKTVTTTHFLHLWTTAWRVPLSTWRALLGVFAWVLLPLISGGGLGAQPQDRFVKGVMNICLFQMGIESWPVGGEVVEAGVRLQKWLAGGGKDGDVGERGG